MISKDRIKNVKDLPGVYIWKDENDKILYVGKAKRLHSRMLQYFNLKNKNSYKTSMMRDRIANFETIICDNERAAFIEERKLIDKYKPFYNVLIPSRSSFPYIKIKLFKDKLDISITNYYKREHNSTYFGPLPNNKNYKPLIKYLTHILLSNEGLFVVNKNYDYWQNKYVEAKNILKHPFKFLFSLREKIKMANQNLDFELSKIYSDVVDVFSFNQDDQNIFIKTNKSIDAIGTFIYNGVLFITIFFYRDGVLINKKDFSFEIFINEISTFEEFLNSYYSNNEQPENVLIDYCYQNISINSDFKILFPNKKLWKQILNLVNQNAKNNIEDKFYKFEKQNNDSDIQDKLSKILNVNCNNIVIFDNSFQINSNAISGVACVYQRGNLNYKMSRHFFHEVNHSRNADVEYMFLTIIKYLKLFKNYPNILIVDGGKQQINEALKALEILSINIPVYGLVKDDKHETNTLISSNGEKVDFDDPEVFNFLTKMQFEVDRYAKKFYKNKDIVLSLENNLLKINGIGPKKLKLLIDHFKTYENINNASLEQLKEVVGLTLAQKILDNRF